MVVTTWSAVHLDQLWCGGAVTVKVRSKTELNKFRAELHTRVPTADV